MHKMIAFEVGDFVFLKVQPMKGISRFGQKDKLSSRYIGPSEIGRVAYRLALPLDMSDMHNVFHVSMIIRWIIDANQKISHNEIEVQKDLIYMTARNNTKNLKLKVKK